MPPIIKDSDTVTTTQETARSGAASASSDSAIKQQPVALEVPITVNGARTVEGSDKREPFSESTKTVLVFGSGAVIRLTSPIAAGQLLFLTNERTKKEVVCQVVKSKNYRNVSGYVELEFTEPAVGFWGMRFPGDRINLSGQTAAPRPAVAGGTPVPPRPVEQKIEPSTANGAPGTVVTKPPVPAPVAGNLDPRAAEPKSMAPAQGNGKPASPVVTGPSITPRALDSATLLGAAKPKSGAPNVSQAPVATSLGSDTPLVEPWLKKREPAARIPAAPPNPVAPKTAAPSSEPEADLAISPTFELSRPSDKAASIFAPSEAPANPAKVDLSSLAPFFEVKQGPTDAPEAPPAAATKSGETEDLKQHTARLQEELSSMQFAEPGASSPVKRELEVPSVPVAEEPVPVLKANPVHESPAQVLENSGASNAAPVLVQAEEVTEVTKDGNVAAIPALSALEQEEMKIPAWLAPLARNTAAPTSSEELIHREKGKRRAEQPRPEEITAELAMPVERAEKEQVTEARVPQFGSQLPFQEEKSINEGSGRKSGNGMLFAAVGAGIVLLAGGVWWYMGQQSRTSASVAALQAPPMATTSESLKTSTESEAARDRIVSTASDKAGSENKTGASRNSTSTLSSAAPGGMLPTAAHNSPPSSNSPNRGGAVSNAGSAAPGPAPEEVKKPALGEVHLKAPKVLQKRNAQAGVEGDAGINLKEDEPDTTADSMGAGLGIASSQPTAPASSVATGGDVRQAKLISSVPPVYPTLAKQQHISGSVTIDALIDASGRVTTMKVISGPALLQQAAMDALKQWKYQPAMLNGTAVPMHLSVTVQFRLQ